MHILMISKACLVGAYQTKLEAMARHDGVRLTVIVPSEWRDPAGTVPLERAHTRGYTLLVDPIRWNGHYHLYYFPTLAERLRTLQPDLVHIDEEPYNLATWLAVRQAQRIGARTLFFSWQNINRRYPPPFRWLERDVLRRVDYALLGNRDSAAVWQAKGYRGPYAILPQFGVPLAQFAPRKAPDPGAPLIIGSAARRLVPEKGLDLLLTAVAGLHGEWQLRLAGVGPEQPRLARQAAALGISERVTFCGALPSTEMPAFLQTLDVLVVPSRTLPNWKEQFGRVLVEAMASEVAVVGSDSGEIPHVIGPAGLVFPEGDATALGERLRRLKENPALRRSLAAAGRARAVALYTQDRVAADTVAAYRAILDGATAPAPGSV